MSLRHEITIAINSVSAENGSDTPDYILAGFLTSCLEAFDEAVRDRDAWHGFKPDAFAPADASVGAEVED